jgi:hypothetical protein
MTRRQNAYFQLDDLLIDMEERNQGLDWPLAVDVWLEQLVAQARAAGMLTTRKELSAALLTWLQPSDDDLVDLLRTYRRRTGRDLLGVPLNAPNVVSFERHGPGPRSAMRRREHGTLGKRGDPQTGSPEEHRATREGDRGLHAAVRQSALDDLHPALLLHAWCGSGTVQTKRRTV